MTNYSPNVHGRTSETTATLPALVAEWQSAWQTEARRSMRVDESYVPRRSIFIREGVQPRGLNRELAGLDQAIKWLTNVREAL